MPEELAAGMNRIEPRCRQGCYRIRANQRSVPKSGGRGSSVDGVLRPTSSCDAQAMILYFVTSLPLDDLTLLLSTVYPIFSTSFRRFIFGSPTPGITSSDVAPGG